MFSKIVFAGALLVGSQAFANDGGVVGVTVEDLKVERVSGTIDNPVRREIQLPGNESIEASFSAGNVRELMKLLPGGVSVYPEYSKRVRELTIASKEGYVNITCSDAEMKSGEGDHTDITWVPRTPSCTVSINKYDARLSDEELTNFFGDWNDLSVPNQCKM